MHVLFLFEKAQREILCVCLPLGLGFLVVAVGGFLRLNLLALVLAPR